MPEIYTIILIMMLVTLGIRVAPFILFTRHKNHPLLHYMSSTLPVLIILVLILYCLREVKLDCYPYGVPELVSMLAVVLVHYFFRQAIISILAGTLLYMAFKQGLIAGCLLF